MNAGIASHKPALEYCYNVGLFAAFGTVLLYFFYWNFGEQDGGGISIESLHIDRLISGHTVADQSYASSKSPSAVTETVTKIPETYTTESTQKLTSETFAKDNKLPASLATTIASSQNAAFSTTLPDSKNSPRPSGNQTVILDWTGFFGTPFSAFAFDECPELVEKCVVTNNRSLESQAHAVIFHARDMNWADIPRQEIRKSWQRYVFMSMESLVNQGVDEKHGANFFNWTATFRRDSDIWWPYFRMVKVDSSSATNIPPSKFDLKYINSSTSKYHELTREAFEAKTKLVAWFVSNCQTSSQREAYWRAFKHYINVDVYGRCGYLECPRTNSESCYEALDRHYKFYLSFENSICNDYVTEKMGAIFQRKLNVIPIVLKRSIAGLLVPSDSFIAADDFASPRELAAFLRNLSANFTAYSAYFNWRKSYVIDPPRPYVSTCQICAKLRAAESWSQTAKVYENIHGWWQHPDQCDFELVPKLIANENRTMTTTSIILKAILTKVSPGYRN